MIKTKYSKENKELYSLDLDSPVPPFDIEVLRKKNWLSTLLSFLFTYKRILFFLKIFRKIWPTPRLFKIAMVTRAVDVKKVLEDDNLLSVPFGAEMRVIGGGGDFILGLNSGVMYEEQKIRILKCFPPSHMKCKIELILKNNIAKCRHSITAEFDPFAIIVKPLAMAICEEYFGLKIVNHKQFYHSALAVSTLLFADPCGKEKVRKLALSGAKYMLETIEISVQNIASTDRSKNTKQWDYSEHSALENLVIDGTSAKDINAIMMGMILGFLPTTIFGIGNALEVFLDNDDACKALRECSDNVPDNDRLDKVIAEAMRFNPIQIGPFRLSKEDCKIGGVKIPAGCLVIPSTLSAMFDPENVDRPEEFNPDREYQNSMVYGHGIHSCIGQPIAEIFAREVFRQLYSLPNLKPNKGKAGRLTKIGSFPDSITMQWNQNEYLGHCNQTMSTIVIPLVSQSAAAALKSALDEVGHIFHLSKNLSKQANLALEELQKSDVIHCMSCCITDEYNDDDNKIEQARLVIEISGDGEATDLFVIVANTLKAANLDQAIIKASGYDGSHQTLELIFEKHWINHRDSVFNKPHLNFNGAPGHSVKRIKNEQKLSDQIRDLMTGSENLPALAQLRKVKDTLNKISDYEWALTPVRNQLSEPPLELNKFFIKYSRRPLGLGVLVTLIFLICIDFKILANPEMGYIELVMLIFAAFAFAVLKVVTIVAISVLIVLLLLRNFEKNDSLDTKTLKQDEFDAITKHEDLTINNHMFAVSRIKPNWLRPLVFKVVLFYIKIAAYYKNKPGILSDIDTIHFARWVRLPGTRQLLFISNYAGSWEAYLEDFITKSSTGLTSIWSNTIGFPRTKDLLQRGAKQSEGFKNWARRQQKPTPLWFIAYPGITTIDIRRNARIRAGLTSIDNEKDAKDWLNLFSANCRPPSTLDKPNIQALLFGSMSKKLPHSELLFVSFNKKVNCNLHQSLLRYLVPEVSFGDVLNTENVLQVAFSHKGLAHLGLKTEQTNTQAFPNAFVQDASSEVRSRILGDTGKNTPNNWRWGNDKKEIDMVLMCYARDKSKLINEVKKITKQIIAANAVVEYTQYCEQQFNKKKQAFEHFGFADGISQPIVKGTPRSFTTTQKDNIVAPGEFLCGYPDERGNISASPLVSTQSDTTGCLTPQLCADEKELLKDFGFNGSYLVIRQLEQHVDAFNDYCENTADTLKSNSSVNNATADWVGAKLIGRWQDGRPLVGDTNNSASQPKQKGNDFRYGKEDPQGLACPLGAHIRRANPRDSLGEDSDLQISLANRHRIIRIGRPYENEGKDKTEKGLMFMCLNANIERQFEFVQQTWLQNTHFHGLHKENDPLGNNKCPMSNNFSVPTENGNVTFKSLPSFTKTHGSGYFFLPGRQSLLFLLNL